MYDINGSRQDSIPLGAVLNVVPYERGFIAVQSKLLSLFKGMSFSTLARTLTSKAKPGQFNRLSQFDDVCDVAVNSQQVRLPSSHSIALISGVYTMNHVRRAGVRCTRIIV